MKITLVFYILFFLGGVAFGISLSIAYYKKWIHFVVNKITIFAISIFNKFKSLLNAFILKFRNFIDFILTFIDTLFKSNKSNPETYSSFSGGVSNNNNFWQALSLIITTAVTILAAIFGPPISELISFKPEPKQKPPESVVYKLPIIQENCDIVEFIPEGEKAIEKSKGNLYKLIIKGNLSNFYENGNILFPKEEFYIYDFTTTTSYINIWRKLSIKLNEISAKRKNKQYYIFIKGSADDAKIPNEINFNTIAGIYYTDYLTKYSTIIDNYLKEKVYYFQMKKNTDEINNLTASPTPKSFTIVGYCNLDLPYLRSMFIRNILRDKSSDLSLPIGVIKGEIVNVENPQYRTVSLYLFETDVDLRKTLYSEKINYDNYFSYKKIVKKKPSEKRKKEIEIKEGEVNKQPDYNYYFWYTFYFLSFIILIIIAIKSLKNQKK